MRNAQRRAFEINRPHVAVFHQTCQHKAPAFDVVLWMRKVVVSPNEIDHLAVTLENAQRLTDSLGANRKAGNERLFEHGKLVVNGLRQPYTKRSSSPGTKVPIHFPNIGPPSSTPNAASG